MGITLLVVKHSALLNRLFGDRQIDRDGAVCIRLRGFHRQLQRIEQAAGITAGHIQQVGAGGGLDLDRPPAVAVLGIRQGPLQQLAQIPRFERLQPEQAGAAHQRLVHLEERVFGGGPDQGDRAVLHPGQQGVLLGGVEAVHLIDEQEAAQTVAAQPFARGLHLGP